MGWRGWKPRLTCIAWQSSGRASDGYYFYHQSVTYGPWQGKHEDGSDIDIWDVHEWVLRNLGICAFHAGERPCDDDCARPEWAEKRRQDEIEEAAKPKQMSLKL